MEREASPKGSGRIEGADFYKELVDTSYRVRKD